jgi:hypothetical protein
MGWLVLPNGNTVFSGELLGSCNVSSLVSDVECIDYTDNYRLTIGKLICEVKNQLPYEYVDRTIRALHKISKHDSARKLLAKLSDNFKGLGHDA